ncbi:MAG: hypothetical protein PUG48_02675 [Clostridia bacterium]|nr:hypothetical protein [Clostridia bacterium]
MKLKLLWLPMVILTLIGGAAKICDTLFNLNGDGFFLNSTACNFTFIICLALLLILGFALSIADRKKNFTAAPVKDTLCGVFGFIASVSLIGGGVISMLNLGNSSSFAGDAIVCLLTLLGGAVLLFESCISFTGHNSMVKMPVLTLAVPLWCCARFVSLFVSYSKVSVHATEMFDIIFVALLLMFLFYQSMFFAQINVSTAVKKTIVYGMPFLMGALIVTIDIIIKMAMPQAVSNVDTYIVEPTITRIISCIGDLALCGYAVCLMKDIMKSIKTDIPDTQSNNDNSEVKSEIKFSAKIAVDEPANKPKTKIAIDDPIDETKPETAVDEPINETEPETVVDEPVDEIKTETVVDEPVDETKPETVVDEPVDETEPKTVVDEPVDETKPETVVDEPVEEIKTETAVDEPVDETEPETAVDEPIDEVHIRTVVAQPEKQKADKNSNKEKNDSAYDEIFRMLDEMSSNNN